jgi:hypothetical protein
VELVALRGPEADCVVNEVALCCRHSGEPVLKSCSIMILMEFLFVFHSHN